MLQQETIPRRNIEVKANKFQNGTEYRFFLFVKSINTLGIEPPLKVLVTALLRIMYKKPYTDNVPSMMDEDFGTVVLITDPSSDRYMSKVYKNHPPKDRLSRCCGGKGGFDDFVERWH